MEKINNKGFTIIEVILSFSFIMIISVGLFISATNYKNKQQQESAKRDLETFKMNIISEIHKEIDKKGLKQIVKEQWIKLKFTDDTWMQIRYQNNRLLLYSDSDNKVNYYLPDESTTITGVDLKPDALDYEGESINTGKAKIYKITININHKELGSFPINIVLPVFSNS